MNAPLRTASGGRVDRATPIGFSFDAKNLTGLKGDTLASALLANGVHLVGRSFKYHRPRGIVTAGAEEPNALVGIDRGEGRYTPNLRATQVELHDGLIAESQNRWPSLRLDVGALGDALSPVFAAGFYYKTFMRPAWAWRRIYEPLIRRAAGLGRAPTSADPDRYASRFAHCDVLVAGGGPAGLAAALAAAESGARVILCDEQAELGGSLLADTEAVIDGKPAQVWLADALAILDANERVRLLPRTQAFGYYAANFVALAERVTDHLAAPPPHLPRERLWQVRARQVVLATGAIERPLVFANNDRPGIMLADAGRTYCERYAALPGRRVVIATTNDSAYAAALALRRAGAEIALIADLRGESDGELAAAVRAAGIRVVAGSAIVDTTGRLRVTSATLAGGETVACDCVLMSGGWTPAIHLFSQSRGKARFDETLQAFVPERSAQAERSAGACRGIFDLGAVLIDGFAAGEDAAGAAGLATVPRAAPAASRFTRAEGRQPTAPSDGEAAGGKAFVDLQNDVTVKDLHLATREGFRSIEHVKRYTTTGMATDQGKTSNMNALAIVSKATSRPIPAVGLTTFRPPYTPVTFGALAGFSRGDLFDPVRQTPVHEWAAAEGAVFEDVGQWKRARYFPRRGEDMQAAVARECRTVRTAVGIFDASTLGKIEVMGPDAAEFLERLYVNPWKKLAVGRCRYGILLNEAGFVIDDGVVGRLAPDRFHLTTTTGGAARVLHTMEDYRQTEFPELKVWLTSTTEQWAVIAVQGSKGRDVIAPLVEGFDLSRAAFPHMAVRTGRICGVRTRLFRVSFTGELGFEINVPAEQGRAVWDAVLERVRKHGGCPYGTETMHVLRAEKGYFIVGQESDGTATPDDLGLGWTIGKAKSDFVGKRSLSRPDMRAPDRPQLVGLLTDRPSTVLEEGAQVTDAADPVRGAHALGHVTSAYWSESLGRSIALALIERGRSRMDDTLYVPMLGGVIPVRIVPPVFLDPKGERLDA